MLLAHPAALSEDASAMLERLDVEPYVATSEEEIGDFHLERGDLFLTRQATGVTARQRAANHHRGADDDEHEDEDPEPKPEHKRGLRDRNLGSQARLGQSVSL